MNDADIVNLENKLIYDMKLRPAPRDHGKTDHIAQAMWSDMLTKEITLKEMRKLYPSWPTSLNEAQSLWYQAILDVNGKSNMRRYFMKDPDAWIAATLANPTPTGTLKRIIVKRLALRMTT
jgi:hypothetical protein